jgi:hypothetical protein
MRAVVGRSLSLKDVVDLQDEALAEIGNVILNNWVATIANLLKRSLPMSLPVVVRGDGKRIFEIESHPIARSSSAHQPCLYRRQHAGFDGRREARSSRPRKMASGQNYRHLRFQGCHPPSSCRAGAFSLASPMCLSN